MKEQELEELFRDAARAAPPASFDEHDIARQSRRVTARRRMATAGGSLVAVAVLAGGVGAGTGLFTPDGSTQAGPTQAPAQPKEPAPRTGGEPRTGVSVFGEPAGSGCGPPDERLATALAARLPGPAGASTPLAATECPTGSRTASFQLREGAAAGRVTAIVSPAGTVPPEQRDAGASQRADGTKQVTDQARSGRIVMVRSNPDAGSQAPYDDRLTAIAKDLAQRF